MKKPIVLLLLLFIFLHGNAQKSVVTADSLQLQFLSFKDLDKKQKSVLPIHLYQVVNKAKTKNFEYKAFKNLNYQYLKYQNIVEAYAERYYLLENLYPNISYYVIEKPRNFKLVGIPTTPPIRKNY